MKQLTIKDKLDFAIWSEFVKNHPQGNIFQTPEMFEVFSETKNYTPIFLAVVDDDNTVQGSLVSVIQTEFSNILSKFTARAIIWGGPLIKDSNPEVLTRLLVAYDKKVQNRVIYSQFRNFWKPTWERVVFESLGFKYEDHLNILVDLRKSHEQLWKEVKPARRKAINKAKRSGVTFRELQNRQELAEGYSIVESVYKNAKLPCPDITLFQSSAEILGKNGMVRFFGAFHQKEMIGVRFVLCFESYIFDWYAGSRQQYYSLRPNDLLPWKVFLWGNENGFTTFDFGGAGSPHVSYGVREYKMKFCSDLSNPGRYQKTHKPFLMTLGKTALSIYKKVI